MTEQDDELKDLFRQKNLEDAFPADEDNWKKMSAVLKSEQKDRRRLFIYLSLVLLLGLGGTWLFNEQNEKNAASMAVNETQTNADAGREDVPNGSKTTHNSEAPVESRGSAKIPDQLKNNKTESKKIETTDPKNNIAKTPVSQAQEKASQQEGKMEIRLTKKTPVKSAPVETVFTKGNASVSMKKVQKTPTTESRQAPEVTENPEKTESANLNSAIVTETAKTVSSEEKTDTAVRDEKRNDVTETQSVEEIKPITSQDPAPIVPFDSTTSLSSVTTTNTPTEPKQDSVIAAVPQTKDSIPVNSSPSHRMFLEAGANYVLGWKTNNQTEGTGFSPLAGLQYYHDVSKKIGLSVGIFYTNINHLSATSHTSTTTRIKFGEETDVTVISALNIHYLLMPLKLNYALSRNDFIGLGYTVAYLLDAQSKVETYSTGLNCSITPTVSRSMGYTKGLNPFDGQLTFCYRRRLYKEIYLNGEFFYGLRDLKNNTIYNSEDFERAMGFRLSLGINLWKK